MQDTPKFRLVLVLFNANGQVAFNSARFQYGSQDPKTDFMKLWEDAKRWLGDDAEAYDVFETGWTSLRRGEKLVLPDGRYFTLTTTRDDVVQIRTTDNQIVTVSHAELLKGLGDAVNSYNAPDLPWHAVGHMTLIANLLRNLNKWCVKWGQGDGRIPEWAKTEQHTPYV